MNRLKDAAQQALEAYDQHDPLGVVMEDLRAALTQSERDWSLLEATQESLREHMAEIHRLRAALAEPQRKPLTEEEIRRIKPVSPDLVDFRSGVRCAERAHGIGGSDD